MLLRLTFIVSLLIIFINQSKSQVTASFTASATQGCSPSLFSFTNQSTGNIDSVHWDFGNGIVSTLLNNTVAVTYTSGGTYIVTLTVVNKGTGDSDNTSITITVYESPTGNFSVSNPSSGCVPLGVSFTDISTQGDGNIDFWEWDFGDGVFSNSQNSTHTYNTAGNYNVSLHISDDNNCVNDFIINNAVAISDKPVMGFSADITQYCSAPVTIAFTDNTTGTTNIVSHLWNFGDGNISSLQNPYNTYANTGSYSVSLNVSDANNCSNDTTYNNFIDISTVNASFDINPISAIYCVGTPIQFTNTSGVSANWLFGDGNGLNNSGSYPIYHIYNNAGTYTVQLIAAPGSICEDITTLTIVVEDVNASFTTSPSFGCKDSLEVTFTDASSINVVSWEWDFGDGTTDSVTSMPITHTYSGQGYYTNTLTVTTANGCTDTYVLDTNIHIKYPYANFFINYPSNVCIPAYITFNDNSTYTGNITNYNWSFGSGAPLIGTGNNPGSTFNTAGEWPVELIIINDAGCTDTIVDTVYVGDHQIPNFVLPPTDTICSRDTSYTVFVTNLSSDTNLIDFYKWNFLNNYFFVPNFVLNDTLNSDYIVLDTGYAPIILTVDYNGCTDSYTYPNAFYVKGPIVMSYYPIKDCNNPYDMTIVADFIDAEYWTWDFGDGTPPITNSTLDSITHTYSATGIYTLTLETYNDTQGCNIVDSILITVTDIQADLNMLSGNCTGDSINLNAYGSQDATLFYFGFGDGSSYGPSNISSIYHTYLSPGTYYDTLIVWDMYGCVDTIVDTLFSALPISVIYSDTLQGCTPFNIQLFGDSSSSDFGIFSYEWDFNYGSSNNINPTHTFNNPTLNHYKQYYVKLIITDNIGCKDTSNIIVKSYGVKSLITASDSTLCLNQQIIVSAYSTNYYNYDWRTETDTLSTPYINTSYSTVGLHSIELIVYDTLGCRDTSYLEVDVQNIIVDLSFKDLSDTIIECYTSTYIDADFYQNNTIDQYDTTYWYWNFNDGATSAERYPQHYYNKPGTYFLVLEAETPYGCTDIDSIPVEVQGPYGTIDISKDTICKDEKFTISLNNTIDILDLIGSFQDGGMITSMPTTYSFSDVGEMLIYLDIFSSHTPECKLSLDTSIFVREVIADFYINEITTNDTILHCSPFEILLSDNSKEVENWYWNFGDGSSQTGQTPSPHTYFNPTAFDVNYALELIVSNDIDCSDTMVKQIIVYKTPPMNISPDSLICRGETIDINVNGGNSIAWSPNKWLNDTSNFYISSTPDSTIKYFAKITDERGCNNLDSLLIAVQQEPRIDDIHNDTSIIIGEYVPLYIYADQENVSYIWSPDYKITCLDCEEVTVQPLTSTTYIIEYTDSTGRCFIKNAPITVTVIEEYSLDVPNTFTPNGDNNNDIVYVRGWGVKTLIEFNIYNRWGELVYFSNDMKKGWDGTYKGKPQNIDTYVYYTRVELYSGKILTKKGTINLLR